MLHYAILLLGLFIALATLGIDLSQITLLAGALSVIRTSDGSEVIVPNGLLISSQVTNWTFSDQKRAVEVSVNVVSGVDSQRMVELLKSVAAGHPDAASNRRH
jgi:small-conductance mechanosensitive channel